MTTTSTSVETDVWAPDPEHPGYVQVTRRKTVDEVYDELVAALGGFDPYGCIEGCDEYFTISPSVRAMAPWPQGRTVVFPVTGGSEGHYVHVEVLNNGEHRLLILGKTFDGWDAAWAFAQKVARILGV